MKRGHIILLAGAGLLVAGIVISTVWGISFASTFMSDNTILQTTSISPGQSVDATRNVVSLDRPLSLAVGVDQQSQPNDNFRLQETVKDPNGRVISSNEFQEYFTTTIRPEVTGVYSVTITNLGSEPVTIGGAFGHVPFVGADGKPNVNEMMSGGGGLGTIIVGGGLAAAGIVVLIIGGIVTVVDSRKRQGTTTSTTSEGGITYRKD